MDPPFPSYTALWHNNTYSSISPTLPSLSCAGKTAIVSGAGSGIGREIALAFAAAGCARLVLMGRREALLKETAKMVEEEFPAVKVVVCRVDVANAEEVRAAKERVEGEWHVLVLCAGYSPANGWEGRIENADVEDWWKGFEINVKGNFLPTQAFLPTRAKDAAIVAVSSGKINLPSDMLANSSSYTASKIAQVKMFEILAVEHPDLHVVSIHPGVVRTAMFDHAEEHIKNQPQDDVKLPAHFCVWVVSPEARFLNGRFVFVNWDVDQLKERADEIVNGPDLKSNIVGWPFSPPTPVSA